MYEWQAKKEYCYNETTRIRNRKLLAIECIKIKMMYGTTTGVDPRLSAFTSLANFVLSSFCLNIPLRFQSEYYVPAVRACHTTPTKPDTCAHAPDYLLLFCPSADEACVGVYRRMCVSKHFSVTTWTNSRLDIEENTKQLLKLVWL